MNARRGVAVGGLMLAAATLVGCAGGTPTPVAPATAVASAPTTAPTTAPDDSHRGGGSRHGGESGGSATEATIPPAALPADWPDVPMPPGTFDGATGAGGSWTVRLRTAGSAAVVQQRTETFYLALGFARTATAGVLVRGPLRLVVVAENRDHSAASSVLVLGLTRT